MLRSPGMYVELENNGSSAESRRFIPQKYYSGIKNPKETNKQINSLKRSISSYKEGIYVNRPNLKTYKNKKSNYITKFNNAYSVSIINKNAVEKVTGVTKKAQERILKKGKGAYYSSGSRPIQTSYSWAYARLASVIMGGKAKKVDQHILDEEGIKIKPPVRSKKGRKLTKKNKFYLQSPKNPKSVKSK
jgi:hypothetical protein